MFRDNLIELRKMANLSQEELAEKIGVSRQTLSKYETGESLPDIEKCMAIADVFDAISARRCYRDAMPLEKCFRIIEEGAGTDFDPDLVDLFLGKKKEIVAYYNQSKKTDSDLL